jgi:Asp-tRNA(Asn)/Glu-tRNA(Gln) amidotransferase A subunit family amidase
LAIESAGVELDELPLADELAELSQAHALIQQFEMARALKREADITEGPRISDELAEYIAGASAISLDDYFAARELADTRRWRWQGRIADQDALLAPSTLGPPPLGLESTGDSLPCRPWTLLGMPCIAIPVAWTPDALPVGVQLVGALERDGAVLDVATWLMDRL